MFCLWHIACALSRNLGSLVIFRLFVGIGGSGVITLGGSIISDLFIIQERGVALAGLTIGLL